MSFQQVVEFAAANHIRYVQFTPQHFSPDASLEETRAKLAVLKLHDVRLYTFGVVETSADLKANRKLFEFARLIGAKLIVVEPAIEDWDSLESLVREYDIRLAIHNHGRGTPYGDPRAVRKVLAARDPRIGVCLDVGWVTQAGFDAAQVFREYQGRVFDIHFKDKRVGRADESAVDTAIGEGSANYSGLFDAIRESGWSGVMAIETDSEDAARNPQPFVAAARAFFTAHAAPHDTAFLP
jgi:sugar phosphate isomerase/epimerase